LQRLTRAFTPANGDCSGAPTSSGLGGPAPYWQSYTYDLSGDRTSITRHATSTSGTDQLDSYNYPAAGHGHELQSVTHSSAPAGGSSYATTGTDRYGYDAAGDTTSAPGQVLGYDAQGELTSVTAHGQTQTSIYDVYGNLLVRSDPTNGTVAYLGDTELTLSPSGQLSANRTYAAGGGAFACRTAVLGGSSPTLTWLAADSQNTATVAVDAASESATMRYFDPFGGDRDVSAPSWPNRDGFLNAPTNGPPTQQSQTQAQGRVWICRPELRSPCGEECCQERRQTCERIRQCLHRRLLIRQLAGHPYHGRSRRRGLRWMGGHGGRNVRRCEFSKSVDWRHLCGGRLWRLRARGASGARRVASVLVWRRPHVRCWRLRWRVLDIL
jgi:YD repeat-containing protein